VTEHPEEHKVVVRDRRKIDPVTGAPREADRADVAAAAAGSGQPTPPAAGGSDEAASLGAQLAERTADLQRITAEYANYRKRVDRDRVAVVDGATRTLLATLLPVLDNVERAREHGDLTGAFKAVADELEGALERLGLRAFGAAGDPFDPMLHEAVTHQTSPDVTVPTCAQVLRRGYRQAERLLRPALVAVVDPEPPPPPATEPVAPSDLPGDSEAESVGRHASGGDAGGRGEPGTGGESEAFGDTGQPGQPGAGTGD
jgi:molecular chaperone GrpE